jgi:hypothetical protein
MQKGGQAIVGGWAKPHYLGSPGLMPAGPVVVYTTKYEGELEVRHFLVSESYRFACNAMNLGDRSHSLCLVLLNSSIGKNYNEVPEQYSSLTHKRRTRTRLFPFTACSLEYWHKME